MECSICMEENRIFKILHCDHVFCEKCIDDLLVGKASANASPSVKCKTNQPPVEEPKDPNGIECPKCRRITKLDNGHSKLHTKYFGHLTCSQCDERKTVDEFRWCHACSASVCSTCFMEKHINKSADGKDSGIHASSKWDFEYPCARFCMQQLRLETDTAKEKASKAKEYIRSYLEGLQEFMYVEIEQKTKATENDHRQKLITLSEAYGIDLNTVKPAIALNRSYQSMLGPLYDLSGHKSRPANFQKQNYKITSVSYKDLTKHLLGNEKSIPDGHAFFDVSRISRKLSSESIIIGANIIKQPSDICLLPDPDGENAKIALITDYESGIYLFKYPTLQLQGPLPLKQTYARYARISTLGDQGSPNSGIADPTFHRRPKVTTFMVTCQATPNGPWVFVLINISSDGSKHEHVQNNKNHHFSLPTNENLHLQSSKRSLFGLSTGSAHVLWRFKGMDDMSWKEVHTVIPHSNSKAYCRIGPISDFTDHTKVLISNNAWQSVDIIKFGWPDDKLWSVQRVELASILCDPRMSVPVSEPILFPCTAIGNDRMILIDKKQPFIYVCDASNGPSYELVKFASKMPVNVALINANSMLVIVQNKDFPQIRALELYA